MQALSRIGPLGAACGLALVLALAALAAPRSSGRPDGTFGSGVNGGRPLGTNLSLTDFGTGRSTGRQDRPGRPRRRPRTPPRPRRAPRAPRPSGIDERRPRRLPRCPVERGREPRLLVRSRRDRADSDRPGPGGRGRLRGRAALARTARVVLGGLRSLPAGHAISPSSGTRHPAISTRASRETASRPSTSGCSTRLQAWRFSPTARSSQSEGEERALPSCGCTQTGPLIPRSARAGSSIR